MDNVNKINESVVYLCEVFEQAVNAYYVEYGEPPSLLIVSPLIYKELEFEYGTNEPIDFMGCDILIDDKLKNHLVYLK
jgi:hypothetical protein